MNMKNTILLIILLLSQYFVFAQDISGNWEGKLDIQSIQLRIVFHISQKENNYSATLDSPDQGAFDLPVDSIFLTNNNIKMVMNKLGAEFIGNYIREKDEITGKFTQMGQSFPLNLKKSTEKIIKKKKYQEPEKPYPYFSEDITFKNKKAGITLAGTLTLPEKEGNFPAVILISGSGAQNRDEELLGHKPFLIISNYLTKQGIAVLRFDDRGTAKSEGDFKSATSKDFATDVEAALNYLLTRKEINKQNIGLIGHSEGGLIAPMLAAKNKNIAFIVLLAGPALPGDKILLMQSQLIGKANGITEKELKASKNLNKKIYALIKNETDTNILKDELTKLLNKELKKRKDTSLNDKNFKALIDRQIKTITSPWFRYFLNYDPAKTLNNTTCPTLALFGSKDMQVPPEENKKAMDKALIKAGNKDYKIIILPGLNHLFQECTTGSPTEYAKIEQTFSPLALKEISDWILAHIKK